MPKEFQLYWFTKNDFPKVFGVTHAKFLRYPQGILIFPGNLAHEEASERIKAPLSNIQDGGYLNAVIQIYSYLIVSGGIDIPSVTLRFTGYERDDTMDIFIHFAETIQINGVAIRVVGGRSKRK